MCGKQNIKVLYLIVELIFTLLRLSKYDVSCFIQMVPSVVGRGRHKGAMLTLGLKDSYVGRQAQNLQGILSLRQPFRGGCVQHWDDLELLWDHVW